jgi:hypothetical protein
LIISIIFQGKPAANWKILPAAQNPTHLAVLLAQWMITFRYLIVKSGLI